MTRARARAGADRLRAGDGPILRLTLLLLLLTAAAQSPLTALLPGAAWTNVLDDLAALAAFACAAPRLLRAPLAIVAGAAVWTVVLAFAATRSTLPPGETLVVARQVLVPVLLVLVGTSLRPEEWHAVRRATIVVGVGNACYALLELAGVHLLDPTALSTFNADRMVLRDGLPAYYSYWFGPGSPLGALGTDHVVRTGGTLLNPPVAGLVAAAALVFAWHERELRGRRVVLVLVSLSTATALARGGFVVAAAALGLSALAARVGRVGTVIAAVPLIWFAATQLADDGDSASHSDGLAYGVRRAFETGVGEGFGHAGNLAKASGLAEASESLAGIAFAAAGLPALVLVAWLLLRCALAATGPGACWEHGLAVGVVVASAFSESAGALNGAAPLWLGVGVALASLPSASQTADAGDLWGPRRTARATRTASTTSVTA